MQSNRFCSFVGGIAVIHPLKNSSSWVSLCDYTLVILRKVNDIDLRGWSLMTGRCWNDSELKCYAAFLIQEPKRLSPTWQDSKPWSLTHVHYKYLGVFVILNRISNSYTNFVRPKFTLSSPNYHTYRQVSQNGSPSQPSNSSISCLVGFKRTNQHNHNYRHLRTKSANSSANEHHCPLSPPRKTAITVRKKRLGSFSPAERSKCTLYQLAGVSCSPRNLVHTLRPFPRPLLRHAEPYTAMPDGRLPLIGSSSQQFKIMQPLLHQKSHLLLHHFRRNKAR